MWYDWVYVHFEEINTVGDTVESYYPSKILGFVKFEERTEAVIHCTEKPLRWSTVEKNFLVNSLTPMVADMRPLFFRAT